MIYTIRKIAKQINIYSVSKRLEKVNKHIFVGNTTYIHSTLHIYLYEHTVDVYNGTSLVPSSLQWYLHQLAGHIHKHTFTTRTYLHSQHTHINQHSHKYTTHRHTPFMYPYSDAATNKHYLLGSGITHVLNAAANVKKGPAPVKTGHEFYEVGKWWSWWFSGACGKVRAVSVVWEVV